ncbi:hypothetical protein MSMEI_4324 [Mycolicibacterium smegmatis MC2 155]|uniref:Uncharacterized protein n=1 Tax=Mycolicibacterium smegmatis (strain ATCC 700084 / mc(2)155) TaxID=246196 RepID=I7FHB6_MYCS2|nr:hypothetical protein MSMEI_4324 [Mycolicibacterium smegmatis MC2 155]
MRIRSRRIRYRRSQFWLGAYELLDLDEPESPVPGDAWTSATALLRGRQCFVD